MSSILYYTQLEFIMSYSRLEYIHFQTYLHFSVPHWFWCSATAVLSLAVGQ